MKRLLSLALILPTAALAHSGHDHGSVGGGFAHPLEGPAQGLLSYALGFALATALLHGAGILAGRAAARPLLRAAGGLTALAGLVLVMGA